MGFDTEQQKNDILDMILDPDVAIVIIEGLEENK